MTGVDDPYEVPTDADLMIDSSSVPVDTAVAAVIRHLTDEGWLHRPHRSGVGDEPAPFFVTNG
jgi:adenylylsulfate kinase-like enzyme